MDFSDHWRSLWSISSVLSPPNLLSSSSSSPIGPLFFQPSSIPLPLFSSPSIAYKLPPNSFPSAADSVRRFFLSASNSAGTFLSSSEIENLSSYLSADSAVEAEPIRFNNLSALRRSQRRSNSYSSVLLFFPIGANAHSIGFVTVDFGPNSEPVVSDLYEQEIGVKRRFHRIFKVCTIAVDPDLESSESLDDGVLTEGHLLVVKMYSVNWFRVESKVLESGDERPVLLPLAKQGFDRCVVGACWNPHFPEVSAVLLENGEVQWFNLSVMKGGKVRVQLDSEDPGGWLSCEYGGQPWTLIVACSCAVLLLDLRAKEGAEPKVLARIRMQYEYRIVHFVEADRFVAFCKAGFDDFQYAVITDKQLLLFDMRQALVPLLMWDHGLDNPCYLAMYRLSELRSSEEFDWGTATGFVILVGSFYSDEFKTFCYGPKDRAAHGNSTFHAWELPCKLSLSASSYGGVTAAEEITSSSGSQRKQKKDLVVGFYLVPHDILAFDTKSSATRDFTLISLTLSGKLEMQDYKAARDRFTYKLNADDKNGEKLNSILASCIDEEERVSTRYNYFRFRYLYEYLNGNLSNALAPYVHKAVDENYINDNVKEAVKYVVETSPCSVSACVGDVSVPTSIHEIASRRMLANMDSDLLWLAFSNYSELFGGHLDSFFEFLDFPFLPQQKLPPFLTGKPSRRSARWSVSKLTLANVVGPVLPLPLLAELQGRNSKSSISIQDGQDDDLVSRECKIIHDSIYPEKSMTGFGKSSMRVESLDTEMEKPFLLYKPTFSGNKSMLSMNCNDASDAVKEEFFQNNHNMRSSSELDFAYKDGRYATFVCGIAAETSLSSTKDPVLAKEMLDFDLSLVRLDFDSDLSGIPCHPNEAKIYKELTGKFSDWLNNFKPYQEFSS